jgi:hypothetical protein
MSIAKAEEQAATPPDSALAERRQGPADRRIALEDRRNSERVAQDIAPRRDPDVKDRRKRR